MKNDKIIAMNGQKIDSMSRPPMFKAGALSRPNNATRQPNSAAVIHASTQKSQTLHRGAIKKPTAIANQPARKTGRNMDIARSNSISRFNSAPAVQPPKTVSAPKPAANISLNRHPIAAKVEAVRAVAVQPPAVKTPKDIKEQAIAEALSQISAHQSISQDKTKHRIRLVKIVAIIIAVVMLAVLAFFVYLNTPSLAINVANAQAGINATYPEYRPDGYSISGPVTSGEGQVSLTFKSNTNNSQFVIKQSKSTWDSTAVKNQVVKDSKNSFITTEERGLTIYSYGGNAAWVNGGILYTITGDAPLTGDQIRRIATSL